MTPPPADLSSRFRRPRPRPLRAGVRPRPPPRQPPVRPAPACRRPPRAHRALPDSVKRSVRSISPSWVTGVPVPTPAAGTHVREPRRPPEPQALLLQAARRIRAISRLRQRIGLPARIPRSVPVARNRPAVLVDPAAPDKQDKADRARHAPASDRTVLVETIRDVPTSASVRIALAEPVMAGRAGARGNRPAPLVRPSPNCTRTLRSSNSAHPSWFVSWLKSWAASHSRSSPT